MTAGELRVCETLSWQRPDVHGAGCGMGRGCRYYGCGDHREKKDDKTVKVMRDGAEKVINVKVRSSITT